MRIQTIDLRYGQDVAVGSDRLRTRIREALADDGVVLLRSVETGDVKALTWFADAVGSPELGIDEELSGPRVMDLRYDPERADSATRPAYFTATSFPLHTDLSYVANPPRYVLTHCVVPDLGGGGISILADCRTAFDRIDGAVQRVLSRPQFVFHPPSGSDFPPGEYAVSDSEDGAGRWRLRLDIMTYSDSASASAVEVFKEALLGVTIGRLLESGDLLIIDNHRMVHGRTAFTDSPEIEKRHMRRVYST